MAFGVVPGDIIAKRSIEGLRSPIFSVHALLLQRTVETLDMGIVVRLSDTGIPMLLLDTFDEPGAELRSVIGLDHVEAEVCRCLHFFEEAGCRAAFIRAYVFACVQREYTSMSVKVYIRFFTSSMVGSCRSARERLDTRLEGVPPAHDTACTGSASLRARYGQEYASLRRAR